MYNTELPTRAELPSSRQLIRSTLTAVVTAVVLLTTAVLPAEYGIDPTGIGGVLGLKRMGEIKTTLALEAAQAAQEAPASQAAAEPAKLDDAPAGKASMSEPLAKNDEVSFTLKPGDSAEIKLDMRKGTQATYRWVARGGTVNFDTHGDPVNPPAGFYHGYGKGRQSAGDQGTLVAAFDGQHGWFWRNRSAADATITLSTSGGYTEIKRVH